jgi:hypothetical protein
MAVRVVLEQQLFNCYTNGMRRKLWQLVRRKSKQHILEHLLFVYSSLQFVQALGAIPVDYAAKDAREQLQTEAPFDLILDCAQSPLTEWSDCLLGAWRNCFHLSLVSPLMTNMDRYGLPFGLLTTAGQILCRNLEVCTSDSGKLFIYRLEFS